jgi:protein TonB
MVPEEAPPPEPDAPPPAAVEAPKPPVVTPPPDVVPPEPEPPPPEQPVAAESPATPPARADVASPKAPPSPAVTARPRVRQPVPARRPGTAAAPTLATPVAAPHKPAAIQADPSASPAAEPARAEAPIAGGWQRALAAWLAAHKSYPEAARQRGEEGVTVLRFTVERSGRVLDVALVRSAGSPLLDAAAEAMVRNGTVPQFPVEMTQDRVTVTVQIRYALAD